MTQLLITFLGRPPKEESGYRTTCYDFGDGGDCEPLAFFGWALQRRLRPDRLVVLGTPGSMWDHLFASDLDFGAEAGDQVDLDVTHGFRHLPMLGLLSALHLRRVKGADITHIWYGAYDPDTGKAPVHDLGGLLHIADWLDALAIYDRTGDYGVFRPLIGGEIGEDLAQAAFLENVNRIGKARAPLRRVHRQLDQVESGLAFPLFRDQLRRRIAWAEQDNYYLRQRELAREYLRRGRFLDSILTGWEAFTTRLLREKDSRLDPDNHQYR